MAVTVLIPTETRKYTGGKSEVAVEAATVGKELDKVTGEHAGLSQKL